MKVLLTEDVPKLGKKGDVKEVKDGYGHNFLIKNKKAILATEQVIKEWEELQEKARQKEIETLEAAKNMKKKIEEAIVEIEAVAGKSDKLFGAITKEVIAEKFKELGFDLSKASIVLEAPIKKLGEHLAKVDLGHGIKANTKINVKAKKSQSSS